MDDGMRERIEAAFRDYFIDYKTAKNLKHVNVTAEEACDFAEEFIQAEVDRQREADARIAEDRDTVTRPGADDHERDRHYKIAAERIAAAIRAAPRNSHARPPFPA